MGLEIPEIIPGDWNRVRIAFQKLKSLRLGQDSSPTYVGLTLTGLTASRLIATDANKVLVSSDLVSWITQTTNQVLVVDDGDGTITLSTPQNIHTGASPTFGGLFLTGTLTTEGDIDSSRDIITNSNYYLQTEDGKFFIGTAPTPDGEIYVSSDNLYIANVTEDKDIIFSFNDGGATKTITIDASEDKLKHSAGTFNFDDDNLTTSGTGTFAGLVIFNPIPILIFKDSTYAGDVSLGYIEWRDVNNTRLGFFGNSSSGNDDLSWVNESSGGHIKIETTGAGEFQIFANLTLSEISTSAAGLNVLRITGLQTDGTAMTGTLRGAYVDVSNGNIAATGTIRGMELKARTEAPGDIGNDVAVLEGLSISADSKDHSVTTMRAAEFILDGSTGGTITEAVGLRIANNLQANKATTSYGLQIYRDSFDYTADIQLSSGGLIGGSTGHLKITSGGTVSLTGNLDLPDNSEIQFGAGGSHDADLGADAILKSDGTNLTLQLESDSSIIDTHPRISFYTHKPNIFISYPVIGFPDTSGIGVFNRYLYVWDTTGTNDGFVYIPDKANIANFLSLTYDSTNNRGVIETFATGSNPDLYLNVEGNVGIGEASPQEKLAIAGNLVLPKTSGNGIKIDNTTPTFGWRDLKGKITNSKGATKPSEVTYRDGITQFQFSTGDDAELEYHIPHDYVPGTDIHLHVHWSHNSGAVTGGSIVLTYEITYAKGHNRGAFPATVTGTITGTASATQYKHIVSEGQISISTGSGTQIDTDDLEPDGLILCRIEMTTNNMTGATPDPFIHEVDVHYQSTNIATKQKAPDFYT